MRWISLLSSLFLSLSYLCVNVEVCFKVERVKVEVLEGEYLRGDMEILDWKDIDILLCEEARVAARRKRWMEET